MKKAVLFFLFLAVLLGLAGRLSAVDVVIGTGQGMASYPMFASNYGYSRYAALYTESEIGITGTITSLAFRVSTPVTALMPVRISLKPVSASVLTVGTWSDLTAGSTLVYDGAGDFTSAGWRMFDIADYNYTGSNLVVLCEGNYGGDGMAEVLYFYYNYYGTTTTTGMALYYRRDNTPPTTQIFYPTDKRANITLTFAGLEIPEVLIVEAFPEVSLSWEAVPGATTYRVESSLSADEGFSTLGSTSNTFYTDTSGERKFYRVYAGTD